MEALSPKHNRARFLAQSCSAINGTTFILKRNIHLVVLFAERLIALATIVLPSDIAQRQQLIGTSLTGESHIAISVQKSRAPLQQIWRHSAIMVSKNQREQAQHEQSVLDSILSMIDNSDLSTFYGFTHEETEKLRSAFQSLRQNDETTFPDFYSDSTCVELFRISSSETARHGGPQQMMQDGSLRTKIRKDDLDAVNDNDCTARRYFRIHPRHSYEDLTKSLQCNCLKHLESLRRCERYFDTKIFVIEYPEVDLRCLFAPVGDIDYNSVGVGDLIPTYEDDKNYGLYRLSRDKKNLLWLQSNLPDIDFIIFVGPKCIEAINHHRADVLGAFLPWKPAFAQAPSITVATSVHL